MHDSLQVPFHSFPGPVDTAGNGHGGMPPRRPPPPARPAGLSLGDIYFIIFRQKWRIVFCAMLGVVTAAALYYGRPPMYESQAKLFIRYVMESRATIPGGDNTLLRSIDSPGDGVINSEREIMTSLDLLGRVVDDVGADNIVSAAGPEAMRDAAMRVIAQNLFVDVPPQGRVVHLTFKHENPAIVQLVLRGIIDQYLKKHIEIHRSLGLAGDFLAIETADLRGRLANTEVELRKARRKIGVVSLEDSKKEASDQIARLKQEILVAEVAHAERAALLQQLGVKTPPISQSGVDVIQPSPSLIEEYRQIESRLSPLRQTLHERRLVFAEKNSRVMEVQAQIEELEKARRAMEAETPGLANYRTGRSGSEPVPNVIGSVNIFSEIAQLRALETKLKVYRSQLEQIHADLSDIEQEEGSIQELQRQKTIEETNYRHYSESLEKSRIDLALSAGRVSNISEIQSPSRPVRTQTKTNKIVILLSTGGLVAGLAWAFAIEHFFDRTLKRPIEIERMLKLPLFLSIPDVTRNGLRHRAKALLPIASRSGSETAGAPRPGWAPPRESVPPWAPAHVLYPFHETLRDRLIAYFDNTGLIHKPKLVAVTGLTKRSGVTTIAAGLAQRLSETGDGNVLLVDMTNSQGSSQQFLKGEAVCGIDELLDTRQNAQVQDNLYVVVEPSQSDRLTRNLPQRFSKLIPKLKASDFDYIIFDMPPVSQISITPRVASFMDLVLLVVESERSDRDVAQRAVKLLSESKVRLGAVLNRVRFYVPRRLEEDSLNEW